jgi:hypothetical protein
MPYIAPMFRAKEKEYLLLQKEDEPIIIERDQLDKALAEGADFYPKAVNPLYEDWIEIPEHHFHRLELEGCLDELEWIPGQERTENIPESAPNE